MRRASDRAATAAMVLVGLAALAVAGRLLPSVPSAREPATTAAAGATAAAPIRTVPGTPAGMEFRPSSATPSPGPSA